MESKFGRGFVIPIVALSKHFALKPEKAFLGAADHLTELTLPDQFRGTRIEDLVTQLRKQVIWHQPGTADAEDAEAVKKTLDRLLAEIDRALGVEDPQIGVYD
ncbi:hypothetical protein E2N92_03655 [Methanofollis formosanus]|uniref:Uncharacterized protein n=1 Tax=Methanofollis formosanus TaxID=299308 RepID=A0A8G1EFY0_9EURY|nr:hypothetical protein [Methanofollis formosanus]QYZ78586.1 hypothetical protein E2N92_03655 [Methanofollis formosanus]